MTPRRPQLVAYHPKALTILACLAASPLLAVDPPELRSWYTANSGVYAKVIEYIGGSPVTTWPAVGLTNLGGGQATPAFSNVQQIRYSSSWVYINATGLAGHLMGPWYISPGNIFGNWPSSQNYQIRFPRNPAPQSGTHTATSGGNIGLWVNGVGFYNGLDAFSYRNASATDRPNNGPNAGDGIWNRSAIAAEAATFDPAYAHQPTNGQYHYHASPRGLRADLNDNITYTAATSTYTENTSNFHHSPILGWSYDGYPVYGPYGYSTANNSGSAIKRMASGYALRNGSNGTTNLTSTGRHTIPQWAATLYNRSTTLTAGQYGPNVNGSYPLGWYAEDYDYLGDHGLVQGTDFDLDRYNGRTCVTPEYPGGTYAYFVTVDASGTPQFPFAIGPSYYGVKSGGTFTTIGETVTTYTGSAGIDSWGSY